MKNRNLTYFFIIFLILIFNSCHTLKNFTAEQRQKKKKQLLRTIELSQIKTTNFRATYSAHLSFNQTKQNISGVIEIKSDSVAKITATSGFGLPLATINITTDSLKIKSMFFTGFNSENKSFVPGINMSVTPGILKDLLLGNIIFLNDTISLDRYSFNLQNDTTLILQFRVPSGKNTQFSQFNNTILFSLNQLKVIKNSFWFENNESQLLISYKSFKYTGNKKVPKNIDIKIIQGIDTVLTTSLKFKKIRIQ